MSIRRADSSPRSPPVHVYRREDLFLAANEALLGQLQGSFMPLEHIAPQVFQAMYQQQQAEFSWTTLLWTVAQRNQYWINHDALLLPDVLQINCGGLGGGALESSTPPHFHCTCPSVGESQVYGPSLSPADVVNDTTVEAASGCTTGIHEIATLFAHTQDPCLRWEKLGFGKAALLYQRTQQVLKAARLLPAHRRLPHRAFLSGLWWKLLSLQPVQLIACLPMLSCLRHVTQAPAVHFTVNGFSAGSYTGAVIALAIRCLWPTCQITARLGAIAMPKGVFTALIATADQDRHHYYLVHAAEDCLCDWKPAAAELDMLQQSLHITYVTGTARWMGSYKHNYSHWLHCQLPKGQVSLTDLKPTHPAVIPNRDRLAAPMRLASWIRFETLMTSEDWEGAISLLVANLHQPDVELLRLLRMCVAGQQIDSMEEAQALLLKNFRVGKDTTKASAQWLTEMARNLLAPIPFREVFVILALFLPQLTFGDGASTQNDLWTSPTVQKYGLEVDITPLPLAYRECMNITLPSLHGRKRQSSALPISSIKALSSWSTAPLMQCTWVAK